MLLFAIGASVLVVMIESVKSIQTEHAILLRDLPKAKAPSVFEESDSFRLPAS